MSMFGDLVRESIIEQIKAEINIARAKKESNDYIGGLKRALEIVEDGL